MQDNIEIDIITDEKDKVNQIQLDTSAVENFYDLVDLIRNNSNKAFVDLKVKRVKKDKKNYISILFLDRNRSKENYSDIYDLILEIREEVGEVEILFSYNNEKLRASKIEELFNNFTQLIQAVIND